VILVHVGEQTENTTSDSEKLPTQEAPVHSCAYHEVNDAYFVLTLKKAETLKTMASKWSLVVASMLCFKLCSNYFQLVVM